VSSIKEYFRPPCFGGLDLAASEKRPSGVAVVERNVAVKAGTLFSDSEILEFFSETSGIVLVVAIDAPLTPAKSGGFREVEKTMLRKGFRLLPLTMASMRNLMARARRIARQLALKGICVIETHPTSVLKQLGLRGFQEFTEFANKMCGIKVQDDVLSSSRSSKHVQDSIICAVVAYMAYHGRAKYHYSNEGTIYLI